MRTTETWHEYKTNDGNWNIRWRSKLPSEARPTDECMMIYGQGTDRGWGAYHTRQEVEELWTMLGELLVDWKDASSR